MTHTRSVVDQILIRIDLAAESFRKLSLWEGDDGSMPSRYVPYGSNPLGYGQCGFITNIVDATGCAGICHGEHNSSCNMLDIASRPPPVRGAFFHYDSWAVIIHTLEVGKEPMLTITRSVHHRQAQDRPGKARMAHDRALDQYFLVGLHPLLLLACCSPVSIGIQLLAQGSLLVQRNGISRTGFDANQASISAVDIPATDCHHTLGDALERLHHGLGILFTVGDHIQHHFRSELLELLKVIRQLRPFRQRLLNPCWEFCLRLPTMHDHDGVSLAVQLMDDHGTNERGPANDEHTHARSFSFQLL